MRQLELERNAKYSMLRCIFSVNEKILFHRLALRISFTRQCKPKSECESEFRKLPLISSPSYKPQVQLQAHLPVNKKIHPVISVLRI